MAIKASLSFLFWRKAHAEIVFLAGTMFDGQGFFVAVGVETRKGDEGILLEKTTKTMDKTLNLETFEACAQYYVTRTGAASTWRTCTVTATTTT